MSDLSDKVINFPIWLENSLTDITVTKEWAAYVNELSRMVGKVFRTANIQKMDQLTSNALDQILLNQSKRLTGSSSHTELRRKLCQLIVRHLTNEVEQRMLCYQPLISSFNQAHPNTVAPWTMRRTADDVPPPDTIAGVTSSILPNRADLITVEAREATVALLTKHPKLCHKLAIRFCNLRNLYTSLLRTDVEKTRSIRDEAILRQCEKYLEEDITVRSMRGSIGCIRALKAVLSFFHLVLNMTEHLRGSVIRIAGTLVLAMSDFLPRNQPPNLAEVVILLEQLFSLMSQLPIYVTRQPSVWLRRYCPSNSHIATETHAPNHDKELRSAFGISVLHQLRRIDSQMATTLLNEWAFSQGTDIPFDFAQQDDFCGTIVYDVVASILESLFAGFLQPDILLFVWDQIMLCLVGASPTPHSLDYLLSAILAILIYLTGLRQSQSEAQANGASKESRTVGVNTEPERKSKIDKPTRDMRKVDQVTGSVNDTPLAPDDSHPRLWPDRIRQVGLQLKLEDIRFLFKNHFFSGFYCLLADMETSKNPIDDASSISATSPWKEWFSQSDQPTNTVLQSRQTQQALRVDELIKLRNLEETVVETQKTSRELRDNLRVVQENSDQLNNQLKQAKLRQQQLMEENRSWSSLVKNMEKKMAQKTNEVDSRVNGLRKFKLSQFVHSYMEANRKKEQDYVNESGAENISLIPEKSTTDEQK
ncbi:unnamed protein product [Echinostoma caproni]|uniref:Rab-GAP TBC domain-containing protein n=1 Tax=Echinostoma caproni TaxID=27848 RepID=A0A183AQQ6_9TREM|nr:unnamed protein product [Echinostoma caproni]